MNSRAKVVHPHPAFISQEISIRFSATNWLLCMSTDGHSTSSLHCLATWPSVIQLTANKPHNTFSTVCCLSYTQYLSDSFLTNLLKEQVGLLVPFLITPLPRTLQPSIMSPALKGCTSPCWIQLGHGEITSTILPILNLWNKFKMQKHLTTQKLIDQQHSSGWLPTASCSCQSNIQLN